METWAARAPSLLSAPQRATAATVCTVYNRFSLYRAPGSVL